MRADQDKSALFLDPGKDELVITFRKILTATDIPKKIKLMLDVLSRKMGNPVDMEFACDGRDIYLLQCRSQGSGLNSAPAPIPQNLQHQDIVFTANRYITNGLIRDISYVVYVDGDAYRRLSSLRELYAVGEAVGQLNGILPRRKYILIGPGRWGSRGDIKLGGKSYLFRYIGYCSPAGSGRGKAFLRTGAFLWNPLFSGSGGVGHLLYPHLSGSGWSGMEGRILQREP